MNHERAIEVLKNHNLWRRGQDETAVMGDVKELGQAIDYAVGFMERTRGALVLVPKEPTDGMKYAGTAWMESVKGPKEDIAGRIYSAMIAAAPNKGE